MPEICVIPTTKGKKPTNLHSVQQANAWIEAHLNPDLGMCGTLPECRGCNIVAYAAVLELTERVVELRESEF